MMMKAQSEMGALPAGRSRVTRSQSAGSSTKVYVRTKTNRKPKDSNTKKMNDDNAIKLEGEDVGKLEVIDISDDEKGEKSELAEAVSNVEDVSRNLEAKLVSAECIEVEVEAETDVRDGIDQPLCAESPLPQVEGSGRDFVHEVDRNGGEASDLGCDKNEASTSGTLEKPLRRFTRSSLKLQDEEMGLGSRAGVVESGSAVTLTTSPPKLELKISKKIEFKRIPTKLKDLLETGLLEGLRVSYVPGSKRRRKPESELQGVIQRTGILCSCDECQGRKVVTPNQFELHAGSGNKRPPEYIYLENGKSLRDVLNACKVDLLESLESVIKNAVGRSNYTISYCLNRKADAYARSLRMHKSVLAENVLPDGTALSYVMHGKIRLDGFKKNGGIFCTCCNEVVSPSQFEAHAGFASRRKPYVSIYTSKGVSLHRLSRRTGSSRKKSLATASVVNKSAVNAPLALPLVPSGSTAAQVPQSSKKAKRATETSNPSLVTKRARTRNQQTQVLLAKRKILLEEGTEPNTPIEVEQVASSPETKQATPSGVDEEATSASLPRAPRKRSEDGASAPEGDGLEGVVKTTPIDQDVEEKDKEEEEGREDKEEEKEGERDALLDQGATEQVDLDDNVLPLFVALAAKAKAKGKMVAPQEENLKPTSTTPKLLQSAIQAARPASALAQTAPPPSLEDVVANPAPTLADAKALLTRFLRPSNPAAAFDPDRLQAIRNTLAIVSNEDICTVYRTRRQFLVDLANEINSLDLAPPVAQFYEDWSVLLHSLLDTCQEHVPIVEEPCFSMEDEVLAELEKVHQAIDIFASKNTVYSEEKRRLTEAIEETEAKLALLKAELADLLKQGKKADEQEEMLRQATNDTIKALLEAKKEDKASFVRHSRSRNVLDVASDQLARFYDQFRRDFLGITPSASGAGASPVTLLVSPIGGASATRQQPSEDGPAES